MRRIPERVEAHCPQCDAMFVISPGRRKSRVQCPTCREIVWIPGEDSSPESSGPAAEDLAELKARVAKLEALTEKLLRRLAPADEPPSEPPAEDSLLSPGAALRWLRRPADRILGLDEEQEAVLLHNLRVMGRRDVVVQSSTSDEWSRELGEKLSAVFRQAGWNVQGPEPAPESSLDSGLVLAAGQCPLPKAAAATYMALKAAGFPIGSRLDANLRPNESVLIAGPANRLGG